MRFGSIMWLTVVYCSDYHVGQKRKKMQVVYTNNQMAVAMLCWLSQCSGIFALALPKKMGVPGSGKPTEG